MPESRSVPVTVPSVRASKRRDGHTPLVMVTAYDAPGARIADAAGVDMILVGDSVANNVLGYEDTLQVDGGGHGPPHRRRGPGQARSRLIVADLPWMSYHLTPVETVRNAAVLIRAGAQAVKLEGGAIRVPDDRGPGRRRDPGHGPPGPHPPVGARHGWLPGPGADAGRRPRPDRRRQGRGRRRLLRRGARRGARVGRGRHHRLARRADHRDRGRSGLRRAGAGLPRPAGLQRTGRPSSSAATPTLGQAATGAVAAFADDVRSGAFPADAEIYH